MFAYGLNNRREAVLGVHGGILLYGTSPQTGVIGSYAFDQDNQRADDDTLGDGSWHNRRIPLDVLQNTTYSGISFGGGFSTDYTFQFASIAVVSADGSVHTIYNGEQETPSYAGGMQGGTGAVVPVVSDQNATHFYIADHLGSLQMEFSNAGLPLNHTQMTPFGQEINPQPTSNHYKFTGKERDTESGLDYFGARYYGSNMGRWMSPDWADKPEAVPYSDLHNPQSLNLYGYVNNNPLSKADPDGHCPTCVEGAIEGAEVGAEVGTLFGPVGTAIGGFAGGLIGAGTAYYVTTKVLEHMSGPQQPQAPQTNTKPEEHEAAPEPQTSTSGAGAMKGGGTIYKVPGSGTKSGKPYIGRHNKANPSKTRKSTDGRDRSQAEVVDTYNAADTTQGRQKEQQQIDSHGGVTELDNKRNEIKKTPQ